MEIQNPGVSSATNGDNVSDVRATLDPVLKHIQKCLGILHELNLTVSLYTSASQLNLLERINALVIELDEAQKAAEACNIYVPLEVIRLIDEGKNPDECIKNTINKCIQKNQITRGKAEAFKNLRKELLDELEKEYPDEVEAYRELRAASNAEAIKQAQAAGALPNGDGKTKT